jgi:hypothetical protein
MCSLRSSADTRNLGLALAFFFAGGAAASKRSISSSIFSNILNIARLSQARDVRFRKVSKMMTDYIYDKETGRCVAYIRDGEVFTDEQDAKKIATVRGSAIYKRQACWPS